MFCTGAATSSSLRFGTDVVDDLAIRIICVDRAGLGSSGPDPAKSFESYRDDVRAVLDHLDVGHVAVVGFSQGAPFALALAPFATRIALVAGQDELAHPRVRPLLVPDVANMVAAIEADADEFAAAIGARADAEGMLQLVMTMSSPHDRAYFAEPAFAAAYRAAVFEAFAQGPAGYVRDLVLAMSRWPTAPEAITVPVELWYGLRDTSPVHSPDFGHQLAARFPHARLHQLADEGSSLLWTRAREILSSVVRS